MNKAFFKKSAVLLLAGVFVLSGCGNGGGTNSSGETADNAGGSISKEPLTLQVFQSSASITDTEFKQLIVDPVKKKYPNITMEIVRETADVKRENLVAASQFPDLVFTDSLSLRGYLDLNLLKDIHDQVKQNKLDLNIYEKRAVDAIKAYGEHGELYGLPFSLNFGALFYNKSIFDKAGVPYPKDGMTWKDTFDLARQLAGKDPSFKALGTSGIGRDAESLRFNLVDPKTGKASINNEDWKYMMQLEVDLQNLPDNRKAKGGRDGFEKDQNLAMYTSYGARIGELEEMADNGQTMDWDMATFPVREGVKDTGMETEVHMLAVSATSTHPNEAFQVIKFLSTDDGIQSMAAKGARVSGLMDDKYKKEFGADVKVLQGKNVQAIFKNKFGPNAIESKYNPLVSKEIDAALKDALAGTDINTVLREAEERANKAIDEAKAAGN